MGAILTLQVEFYGVELDLDSISNNYILNL